MISKVDLVMWTKNGESHLNQVMKRVEDIIPSDVIHRKILVDDHSLDRTVKIAKNFNWETYINPTSGISSGANETLRHVDCDFFVSIEQDILLSKDWWNKIPKHMENKKNVVAQGIRISTEPTLRKLDEYVYSRMKSSSPIKFGVSMDNNIFQTDVIREVGGFPSGCPVCTDTILMKKIMFETPYAWYVDRDVVSLHIRKDVKYHLQHCYKLSQLCAHTHYCVPLGLLEMQVKFLTSPIRGLIVAYKKKCPQMIWVYPQIRFMKLKGFLERRTIENS